MTGKAIFGAIVLAVCGFGCGTLFYGIGIWAQKKTTPMHFWAGTEINPNTISDIPAYNRANSRMWKIYSIPYWLSGIAGILEVWNHAFSAVCLIILIFACTVGLWLLVCAYKRIEKQYKIS